MKQAISPKLLVAILTLGVFSIINTEMGVVGMIPLIAERFGVSVATAGWTVTVFAVGIAVCAPVMPLLFSRFERKRVMLFCLGVFALSTIPAAFTESFAVLLAMRIIPALVHPVYVSLAFSTAAQSVPPAQSPAAVARIFIGVSAGMVLGVPLAGFMSSAVSFEAAMLFFSATSITVWVLTAVFVPSSKPSAPMTYGSQLRVLKRPAVWYAFGAVVFTNGSVFGFFSFMADFLKSVSLLDYTWVSIILAVYGASNILGNVAAGRLLTTRTLATIRATPWFIAATLVALFFIGHMPVAAAALIFVFGILTGISSNNSQYLITQAASDAPIFANGLFLSGANSGTAFGTMLCGLFIDNLSVVHSVEGSLICIAAAMASIALAIRAGRRSSEELRATSVPHPVAGTAG